MKEKELLAMNIGTTHKGIGPTYSSKASRSGLRIHHLLDFDGFTIAFKRMVANKRKRYGEFEYDVEAELLLYSKLALRVKPYVVDSVVYINTQLDLGKRVLVEGIHNTNASFKVRMHSCLTLTLALTPLSLLQTHLLAECAQV